MCRGICIDCGYCMPMVIMQNYSRSREELPQGVLDNGYGIIPTFPAYVCQRVVNKFGKTVENHVARIGTKNPDSIRDVKCKKSRNTFIGVNDHIKANLEKLMRNADAAGGDSDAQWTAYLTLPHTQEALKACLRHRTWLRAYGNDPNKKLAIGRKTYTFGGRVTSFLSGAPSSSTPSRR